MTWMAESAVKARAGRGCPSRPTRAAAALARRRGRRAADAEAREQHQDARAAATSPIDARRPRTAPRQPSQGSGERHRRGHRDLAEVAGEVVGAERHAARPGLVGLRHERGRERVLAPGAEARQPGGRRGARRSLPVSPATRKPSAVTAVPAASSRASPQRSARMPAGHLEGGHAAGVERPEQPDLREAQAELGRPDRAAARRGCRRSRRGRSASRRRWRGRRGRGGSSPAIVSHLRRRGQMPAQGRVSADGGPASGRS